MNGGTYPELLGAVGHGGTDVGLIRDCRMWGDLSLIVGNGWTYLELWNLSGIVGECGT